MTSWVDIERIRKDLVAIRALAKRLLKLSAHEWTHWELDFLEDRSRQTRSGECIRREPAGRAWGTGHRRKAFTHPAKLTVP